ncbi:unnamed protein product [Linum trigynum]|uniref:Uncharacterized protein n=1 Tax=Linum trigynum TaxID=586398 RepID=A0AAV2DYH8_9ROSI
MRSPTPPTSIRSSPHSPTSSTSSTSRGPTAPPSQRINGKMLRNLLAVVVPNVPNLQHICLQIDPSFHVRHQAMHNDRIPPASIFALTVVG